MSLDERVKAAVEVARTHAEETDGAARVPHAAIESLKQERLLGPGPEPGGPLWTAAQIVSVASALGAACSSTGLIWAMQQGQMQSLARHSYGNPALRAFVDAAGDEQPLIASVVSERGAADPRVSQACCVADEETGTIRITKQASVASYLDAADAILLTARRDPESGAADQVLVLARRSEMTVSSVGEWNALGMCGTASAPADVEVEVPRDQVFPDPFGTVAAMTMNPITHLGWGACWLGIASGAVETARIHLRTRSRKLDAELVTAKTMRLGELARVLAQLRAQLDSFAAIVDQRTGAPAPLDSELTRASNFLRLSAAELAFGAAIGAFELIGIEAYRTGPDDRFGLGRQIRDLLSALVMISGDRIRLADGYLTLYPGAGSPTPAARR